MKEIRKDIPGYEGYYQASSLGSIRSVDRIASYNNKHGIITRGIKGKSIMPICNVGYHYVNIRHNNKSVCNSVHSLVAITFIGTRPVGSDINHIDGDKANNSYMNLEYCTRSENMRHALRLGLMNYRYGVDNKQSKKIRILGNGVDKVVFGTREASDITGVDKATISKRCRIPLKRLPYNNSSGYSFAYV